MFIPLLNKSPRRRDSVLKCDTNHASVISQAIVASKISLLQTSIPGVPLTRAEEKCSAVSYLVGNKWFKLFESQGRGQKSDEHIARPTGQATGTLDQSTNLARAGCH